MQLVHFLYAIKMFEVRQKCTSVTYHTLTNIGMLYTCLEMLQFLDGWFNLQCGIESFLGVVSILNHSLPMPLKHTVNTIFIAQETDEIPADTKIPEEQRRFFFPNRFRNILDVSCTKFDCTEVDKKAIAFPSVDSTSPPISTNEKLPKDIFVCQPTGKVEITLLTRFSLSLSPTMALVTTGDKTMLLVRTEKCYLLHRFPNNVLFSGLV